MCSILRHLFSRRRSKPQPSDDAAIPLKTLDATTNTAPTTMASTAASIVLKPISSIFSSTPCKKVPKITPALLRLPNEMLLQIIGELDLHEKFILCQTSRALRKLSNEDWGLVIGRFSYPQQLDFWVAVARHLPDYWVCGTCYALHKVFTTDKPLHGKAEYCQPDGWQPRGMYEYHIRHSHVQFAIKLTTMGNGVQKYLRQYLKEVMSPHTTERAEDHDHIGYRQQLSPKVVGENFIMLREDKFRGRVSTKITEIRSLKVCPHFDPLDWSFSGDRQKFGDDIRNALKDRGREMKGSCRRCRTDYSVLAKPGLLTVRAWHDFGGLGSPEDATWTAHLPSSENSPHSPESAVVHEPGSIQRLYEEAEEEAPIDQGPCPPS